MDTRTWSYTLPILIVLMLGFVVVSDPDLYALVLRHDPFRGELHYTWWLRQHKAVMLPVLALSAAVSVPLPKLPALLVVGAAAVLTGHVWS